MHEEARTGYERIRLLSDSIKVQEAGRFALRHAYAMWQVLKARRTLEMMSIHWLRDHGSRRIFRSSTSRCGVSSGLIAQTT